MTRLILHFGTHKTGTTAIQGVLASKRSMLSSRGICYPESWKFFGGNAKQNSANAHAHISTALARNEPSDIRRLRKFSEHLQKEAQTHHTIVLSAEAFNRRVFSVPGQSGELAGREAFLDRVRDYFSNFETEVAIVYRRPDQYAESMYSESIANSQSVLSFDGFLKRSEVRFNYGFQLKSLEERFPTLVAKFDDLKDDLVNQFLLKLSLDVSFPKEDEIRRTSISKAGTLWLRRSKRENREMEKREKNLRWLFALQSANASVFGTQNKTSFWSNSRKRDEHIRTSLEGFTRLTFDMPSQAAPRLCSWDDNQHFIAENAYKAWLEKDAQRISRRLAAQMLPFVDPDGGPIEAGVS
ncbi:hypothetical protein Q8W37_09300 [Shimia thalassica]|uniref:hypothetical protein n=1 Tax=Shimia thalassica TaxID=1715693 RepID=UPI00273676C3|nr:hypothetical protein [Shimia thalassica]MDP2580127.1 hypothetical protein [Shimia thalassica]